MDITQKCIVSGKQGFDSECSNRFVILIVDAKNGDLIKVNKVGGIKYSEIWTAFEHPDHEEHPIIDNENKIVVVGGEDKASKRTICILGK